MIKIEDKDFSEGFMHDLADLIDRSMEIGTDNIEVVFDVNGKTLSVEMTFSVKK